MTNIMELDQPVPLYLSTKQYFKSYFPNNSWTSCKKKKEKTDNYIWTLKFTIALQPSVSYIKMTFYVVDFDIMDCLIVDFGYQIIN